MIVTLPRDLEEHGIGLGQRAETHGVCSDLISRQAAIDAIESNYRKIGLSHNDGAKLEKMLKALPSAEPVQPHQVDCTGCKFVGTYDTDFPCANCLRKTKDYYCGAKMDGGVSNGDTD